MNGGAGRSCERVSISWRCVDISARRSRMHRDMTSALYWLPLNVREWLGGQATSQMTLEQQGAFLRLILSAWDDGAREPSLPNDDRSLAELSGLRRRWRSVGALLRAQFEVRDGRLYSAWLSEIWKKQQRKH